MAKDQQKAQANEAEASEAQEQEVIFKLNPETNLGGYAFSDGRSILPNQPYRATESEYAEYQKARTTRSDGSTLSVVKKV